MGCVGVLAERWPFIDVVGLNCTQIVNSLVLVPRLTVGDWGASKLLNMIVLKRYQGNANQFNFTLMSQGNGYVYHTFVLPCGTSRLYSDVVECSTIDRRVPGSIIGRDIEIF